MYVEKYVKRGEMPDKTYSGLENARTKKCIAVENSKFGKYENNSLLLGAQESTRDVG